jgi:hypothetical protein
MPKIEKFGCQWKDKPDQWKKVHPANIEEHVVEEPRHVRITGDKAPEVPQRIVAALQRLGAGNWKQGLQFIWEHPAVSWNDQTEPQYQGQRVKLSQDVEAAFRRAWMRANG